MEQHEIPSFRSTAFNPPLLRMQQCDPSPHLLSFASLKMQPPRPILKRTTSAPSAEKHVVHFPPSPALTRTFDAHSPAAYDRSPIVVSPNVCALPERGGRTYVLDETATSPCPPRKRSPSKPTSTRATHQRPLRDAPSIIPSMPSLVPDLSSESDESDGFPSPNLENQEFFFGPTSQHGPKSPDDDTVRSFLPHPPSYPYYSPVDEETAYVEKPRRRRERRIDTPRDNDLSLSRTTAFDITDEEATTPRRKPTKRRSPTSPTSPTSLCDSFSSLALNDDGCLGGF